MLGKRKREALSEVSVVGVVLRPEAHSACRVLPLARVDRVEPLRFPVGPYVLLPRRREPGEGGVLQLVQVPFALVVEAGHDQPVAVRRGPPSAHPSRLYVAPAVVPCEEGFAIHALQRFERYRHLQLIGRLGARGSIVISWLTGWWNTIQ